VAIFTYLMKGGQATEMLSGYVFEALFAGNLGLQATTGLTSPTS
jgi:hypothetical protein